MVSSKLKIQRWFLRAGLPFRVFLFLVGTGFLSLLVYFQRPEEETTYLGMNLLVFSLVNINLIMLCVLMFLVGRNVVKLVFDRRRNIIGSRLRQRLVMAFVGLTMIPTIILFVLASGLLNQALESWFKSQVEVAVQGSVKMAQLHLASVGDSVSSYATYVAREVERKPLVFSERASLRAFLKKKLVSGPLDQITVFENSAGELLHVGKGDGSKYELTPVELAVFSKGLRQADPLPMVEELGERQVVRVLVRFEVAGTRYMLQATQAVTPEMSEAVRDVHQAAQEYEQLKLFRSQLKSSALLTLAMITGLILFAAIWIGFYLAREISVPVQKLAEATDEVAKGNYDISVKAIGNDEISYLIKSFNRMIGDLRLSRSEVERRQGYIETILESLVVGVVGLDNQGMVTSVNQAGSEMFGYPQPQVLLGADIFELFAQTGMEELSSLVRIELEEQGRGRPRQREVRVVLGGKETRLVCTSGGICDPEGKRLGTLILFDDVTGLAQAQQQAAWREVARRIAHEIKNPLTPIQLCAQRLERLLGGNHADPKVRESTQTIVEHVHLIKRLADEFSNFARMPRAELRPTELCQFLASFMKGVAQNNPDVRFQLRTPESDCTIMMDPDQFKRVLINLTDNALAAIREAEIADGEIVIALEEDAKKSLVRCEVLDNGVGIPNSKKSRVFEPYFTTKKGGTGLGLAIVSSVVADHHGELKIYDNKPRGTRIVIELPENTSLNRTSRKLHD